jgi:hypothetical protein
LAHLDRAEFEGLGLTWPVMIDSLYCCFFYYHLIHDFWLFKIIKQRKSKITKWLFSSDEFDQSTFFTVDSSGGLSCVQQSFQNAFFLGLSLFFVVGIISEQSASLGLQVIIEGHVF